jgi:hypothetical protein
MVAINNMLCYKSKQNQSKRVFKCRFQTWKELSEHIEENDFSVNRNECRKTIENIRSLLGSCNVATATKLPAFAVVPANRKKKTKVSTVTTTTKEHGTRKNLFANLLVNQVFANLLVNQVTHRLSHPNNPHPNNPQLLQNIAIIKNILGRNNIEIVPANQCQYLYQHLMLPTGTQLFYMN